MKICSNNYGTPKIQLVIIKLSVWLAKKKKKILYHISVKLNAFNIKLKGPISSKKQVFSGLYIYKLVLPEPANSPNEENKRFLHGFCGPPTSNMALLQAV